MSDNSLLPDNASELEQDVASLFDANGDINKATTALRTAKLVDLPDSYLPWLLQEYGLEDVNPWVLDLRETIRTGVQWQRIRGTPKSLNLALSWVSFTAKQVEEEETGQRFYEFQIELDNVPVNPDLINSIDILADLSSPLRSRLSRLYNDVNDIRRFKLSESSWGDLLSDYSGVRSPYGVKHSFGRRLQCATTEPESATATHYGNGKTYDLSLVYQTGFQLDYSLWGELPIYNHKAIRGRLLQLGTTDSVNIQQEPTNTHTFSWSGLVLSDSQPLGEIHTLLSGGRATEEVGETFVISRAQLSEVPRAFSLFNIDRVVDNITSNSETEYDDIRLHRGSVLSSTTVLSKHHPNWQHLSEFIPDEHGQPSVGRAKDVSVKTNYNTDPISGHAHTHYYLNTEATTVIREEQEDQLMRFDRDIFVFVEETYEDPTFAMQQGSTQDGMTDAVADMNASVFTLNVQRQSVESLATKEQRNWLPNYWLVDIWKDANTVVTDSWHPERFLPLDYQSDTVAVSELKQWSYTGDYTNARVYYRPVDLIRDSHISLHTTTDDLLANPVGIHRLRDTSDYTPQAAYPVPTVDTGSESYNKPTAEADYDETVLLALLENDSIEQSDNFVRLVSEDEGIIGSAHTTINDLSFAYNTDPETALEATAEQIGISADYDETVVVARLEQDSIEQSDNYVYLTVDRAEVSVSHESEQAMPVAMFSFVSFAFFGAESSTPVTDDSYGGGEITDTNDSRETMMVVVDSENYDVGRAHTHYETNTRNTVLFEFGQLYLNRYQDRDYTVTGNDPLLVSVESNWLSDYSLTVINEMTPIVFVGGDGQEKGIEAVYSGQNWTDHVWLSDTWEDVGTIVSEVVVTTEQK